MASLSMTPRGGDVSMRVRARAGAKRGTGGSAVSGEARDCAAGALAASFAVGMS